ncbi:hypothetical protein ACWFRJ_41460 [Streptomyces sp. NPDC055239]
MREPGADEQRRMADKREAIADERETIADRREAAADARQDQLAAEGTSLDARARAAGDSAARIQQRSYEQIDRIQGLLTASQERLDRNNAGLRRSDAKSQREQEAIDREVCASLTLMDAQGLAPLKALEAQADRLRESSPPAWGCSRSQSDTGGVQLIFLTGVGVFRHQPGRATGSRRPLHRWRGSTDRLVQRAARETFPIPKG